MSVLASFLATAIQAFSAAPPASPPALAAALPPPMAPPTPPTPPTLPTLPPARVPAPAEPARPLAPIGAYVGDYPAAALRAGEQGIVAFRLDVGPDGRATGCEVTSSSGSSALDSATCRALLARARFRPARDAVGRPVPGAYRNRIVWRLPAAAAGPPASPPR